MDEQSVMVTPPERQAAMRLADGRSLAWSEWGAEDGLAVLFCTGAALSGSLGFGANVVSGLGLRLIATDRTGLGRSDPHPAKTLSSWADDVRQLIQVHDLATPLAVGFSQGAPFAFALADARLVRAMAIVSGQDQLAHPAIRSMLHSDVAGMVAAVQRDAAGFEQYFAGLATADGMWELIVGMSGESDRTLYESESFGGAFRRGATGGLCAGGRRATRATW